MQITQSNRKRKRNQTQKTLKSKYSLKWLQNFNYFLKYNSNKIGEEQSLRRTISNKMKKRLSKVS